MENFVAQQPVYKIRVVTSTFDRRSSTILGGCQLAKRVQRLVRRLVRKHVRNAVSSELAFERQSCLPSRREMYVSTAILFLIVSIGRQWILFQARRTSHVVLARRRSWITRMTVLAQLTR